jgi:hypothetical protein
MNIELTDDEALVLFELLHDYGAADKADLLPFGTQPSAMLFGRCNALSKSGSLRRCNKTTTRCLTEPARASSCKAARGSCLTPYAAYFP